MPPLIRPTGHLLPLRSPSRTPSGTNRAKNLLDHHQFHHPNEEYLRPFTLSSFLGTSRTGYDFFGRFVEFGTGLAPYLRISDVAALALEQTFGKADTLEEIFSVPWAIPDNRSMGSVFWDVENDRIIAKTREGFTLALRGTNVVEAAVYLPKIYEEIKLQLLKQEIPEGIDIIEAAVEEPNEAWSVAASPLHIRCTVRNLGNIHPSDVSRAVAEVVEHALANRL